MEKTMASLQRSKREPSHAASSIIIPLAVLPLQPSRSSSIYSQEADLTEPRTQRLASNSSLPDEIYLQPTRFDSSTLSLPVQKLLRYEQPQVSTLSLRLQPRAFHDDAVRANVAASAPGLDRAQETRWRQDEVVTQEAGSYSRERRGYHETHSDRRGKFRGPALARLAREEAASREVCGLVPKKEAGPSSEGHMLTRHHRKIVP